MVNRDEMLEKIAKQETERKEEERLNPLSQYSTSQLKAELRRRKRK